MSQPTVNDPKARKPPVSAFNQTAQLGSHRQFLTEARVKEIVMEILIEFDMIPNAQKKKGITLV
jgi:hypothetical protein